MWVHMHSQLEWNCNENTVRSRFVRHMCASCPLFASNFFIVSNYGSAALVLRFCCINFYCYSRRFERRFAQSDLTAFYWPGKGWFQHTTKHSILETSYRIVAIYWIGRSECIMCPFARTTLLLILINVGGLFAIVRRKCREGRSKLAQDACTNLCVDKWNRSVCSIVKVRFYLFAFVYCSKGILRACLLRL